MARFSATFRSCTLKPSFGCVPSHRAKNERNQGGLGPPRPYTSLCRPSSDTGVHRVLCLTWTWPHSWLHEHVIWSVLLGRVGRGDRHCNAVEYTPCLWSGQVRSIAWVGVSTYKFQGSFWCRIEQGMTKERDRLWTGGLHLHFCLGFYKYGQVWHICLSYCIVHYRIRYQTALLYQT